MRRLYHKDCQKARSALNYIEGCLPHDGDEGAAVEVVGKFINHVERQLAEVKPLDTNLRDVRLKDALCNCSERAVRLGRKHFAEDVRYGRGVLVGVVSAMTANGLTFEAALGRCYALCPDLVVACIPDNWPKPGDLAEMGERAPVTGK